MCKSTPSLRNYGNPQSSGSQMKWNHHSRHTNRPKHNPIDCPCSKSSQDPSYMGRVPHLSQLFLAESKYTVLVPICKTILSWSSPSLSTINYFFPCAHSSEVDHPFDTSFIFTALGWLHQKPLGENWIACKQIIPMHIPNSTTPPKIQQTSSMTGISCHRRSLNVENFAHLVPKPHPDRESDIFICLTCRIRGLLVKTMWCDNGCNKIIAH